MSIVLIPRGETINGQDGPTWLYVQCETSVVAYWCETHQKSFPHRQALTAHCREEGEHRIARYCPKHGYEAITPTKGENAA